MMKQKVSRKKMDEILVSDKFFNRGSVMLKVRQGILTIVGWTMVVSTFCWLLIPGIFYEKTLKFFLLFFTIVILVITISFLLLTIWNNHRYKNILKKKIVINKNRIEKNNEALEQYYDHRFGKKDFRKNVRFYIVPAEKNIANNDITEIYNKRGE